jgi:predicted permease
MNWTRLINRLKGTPARHEEDLDDELAFHRTMKERALVSQGMSAAEARAATQRALGNLTLTREDARAQWSFTWISDLGRDLRYACRTLVAQPGFAIAGVLALVLGIGVNAILFNIYNALALTPWAVRDAGRVVKVLQEEHGGFWSGFSWPSYRYLRDHTQTFAGLTAFENTGCRATRHEESWAPVCIAADEDFFNILGTGFAVGRGFSPSNGNLKDPAPEVILHYQEWIRHFGGDRAAVGEWIELNGRRMQIVGVAAEGFSGPVPISPSLWVPAPWRDLFHPGTASIDNANNCCTRVIGRLKDGVEKNAALAELSTLSSQFNQAAKRETMPIQLTKLTLLSDPKSDHDSSPAFLAISVASFLILLLACANVANLQLARSVSRWREFSVRVSLGASRGRILRQLVVEALVLSAIAGLLTALVSSWAPNAIMQAVAAATNAEGSLNFTFSNDYRVIVFVAAVSLLAALLFGLAPAWSASRNSVSLGLQQGGRSTATGRVRKVLLATQVILCTILLSGATLLVRALDEARHADPGFAAEQMVVVNPNLDSSGVPEAQTAGVTGVLRERIRTLPGVTSVAHAVVVPLGRRNDSVTTELPATHQAISFNHNRVAANFFETMGIPMVAGRAFIEAEETRKDAVVVNETLAKRAWPNQNPLGKELFEGRLVVGVVRDFHIREIGPAIESGAFVPGQPSGDSQLLIRFAGLANAQSLATQSVKLARTIDPRLKMTSAEPYSLIIDRARQTTILVAAIAGVLSSLALVLACVGIYGVAAYSVSQRTREIGVRMALGAKPQSIAQMVLGENLRVVLVGAALGIAGAIAFGRLLTSLLFGVKPGDPTALFATMGILLATAGLAAWIPARRAASVDPAITLRHD